MTSPFILFVTFVITKKKYRDEELDLYHRIHSTVTGKQNLGSLVLTQTKLENPDLFEYATCLPYPVRLQMILENSSLLTEKVLNKDSGFKDYLINVAENNSKFTEKCPILKSHLVQRGVIGRIISRVRYAFRDTFTGTKTL